jgi:hypothetical protein
MVLQCKRQQWPLGLMEMGDGNKRRWGIEKSELEPQFYVTESSESWCSHP